MIRVYTAGRMGGRMGWEVLDERARAREALEAWDLEVYDPATDEGIDPNSPVDLRMDLETMKRYVSKDEYAIKHCDVLLVLTGDTPSEGTGIEIGLALYLGMPVVLVAPKRVTGALMGFWNVKADAICSTMDEAAQLISENYGGQCENISSD